MAEGSEGSRRQLVAACIIIALIVVAGLWLSGALHQTGSIQDCAMSGRTNCAPVEAPAR